LQNGQILKTFCKKLFTHPSQSKRATQRNRREEKLRNTKGEWLPKRTTTPEIVYTIGIPKKGKEKQRCIRRGSSQQKGVTELKINITISRGTGKIFRRESELSQGKNLYKGGG